MENKVKIDSRLVSKIAEYLNEKCYLFLGVLTYQERHEVKFQIEKSNKNWKVKSMYHPSLSGVPGVFVCPHCDRGCPEELLITKGGKYTYFPSEEPGVVDGSSTTCPHCEKSTWRDGNDDESPWKPGKNCLFIYDMKSVKYGPKPGPFLTSLLRGNVQDLHLKNVNYFLRNTCSVCAKLGLFKCAACNDKLYCSKECQTQDWKVHKKKCAKFNRAN